MADISITISDADSDSNVPPSKWAEQRTPVKESMPNPCSHPCGAVRRGVLISMKLLIMALENTDGEVDGQMYGDVVMDDSDAEICMWVPGKGMGTLRKTSRPRVDVRAHSRMERLTIVKTTLCERKMRYPSLHQREPSLQSTSLGLPPLP